MWMKARPRPSPGGSGRRRRRWMTIRLRFRYLGPGIRWPRRIQKAKGREDATHERVGVAEISCRRRNSVCHWTHWVHDAAESDPAFPLNGADVSRGGGEFRRLWALSHGRG